MIIKIIYWLNIDPNKLKYDAPVPIYPDRLVTFEIALQ